MKIINIIFFLLISTSVSFSAGGSGGENLSVEGYNSNLVEIIAEINSEDYSTALTMLEGYVYENPDDADGWNYIGFVSRKLKNFDAAERYYLIGLEINPNHVGILEYQGELYVQTNRINDAKVNLEKLNKLCVFNCSQRDQLRQLITSN